ncbi:MAG TPA: hypothetical protein VMA30_20570 [Xanthobacteraceae bacterium]|nr:hypothetical protein [Xanthobacteraceae bacterium]
MKKQIVLVGLTAAVFVAVAQAQQAAPPAPQTPVPYVLTMGDMMNTLVQPRHAKLGLAGHAGNWRLAAYALAEIREAFAGIVKAQPKFHGYPVADLADAALKQPLAAVDDAIKAEDPKKFAAAYARLTQGCNACHASLDHPFVVIKVPDASAFPNQEFNARP